jgi:uncharacterized membrane protein
LKSSAIGEEVVGSAAMIPVEIRVVVAMTPIRIGRVMMDVSEIARGWRCCFNTTLVIIEKIQQNLKVI